MSRSAPARGYGRSTILCDPGLDQMVDDNMKRRAAGTAIGVGVDGQISISPVISMIVDWLYDGMTKRIASYCGYKLQARSGRRSVCGSGRGRACIKDDRRVNFQIS